MISHEKISMHISNVLRLKNNFKKKPIAGNSEVFETRTTLIPNTEIYVTTLCSTLCCYVEVNHKRLSGKM